MRSFIGDYTQRNENCCVGITLVRGPTAPIVNALSAGNGVIAIAEPSRRLAYRFTCAAERSDGSVTLTADAYDGSGLDWYSVDKSPLGPTPIISPCASRP